MRENEREFEDRMNFESWLKTVPVEFTSDSLWKVEAYRLALFAADLGWHDTTKLVKDRRTLDIAGQLYRAVGSIDANISEGYSKSSGRDRARFYEYALGSTRESRGWYFKGRHILGGDVAQHRISLLTHIARLLLTMIPEQRASALSLHESGLEYRVQANDPDELRALLSNIPM